MTDEEQVCAAEAARCAAIAAQDWAAVATLLDDDYVHVHGTGRVTDKAATLAFPNGHPVSAQAIRQQGDDELHIPIGHRRPILVGQELFDQRR